MVVGLLKKMDWFLLALICLLIGAGLISLFSHSFYFFKRQLLWAGLFLVFYFSTLFFNWRWLINQKWFRVGLYLLSILLLILVYLKGEFVRGARSWFNFGGFQFQPSELAKLSLVLMLAHFFAKKHIFAWVNRNFFISLFYVFVPAVLVLLQPDLGSALVLIGLWFCFILISGLNKKKFFLFLMILLILGVFAWFFYLRPYQKDRIIGFLFPEHDPLGINYNSLQAKIAIGSAGLLGKGFKEGSQVQFDFLPEKHSDFIFAAFVEEWGFLGVFILISIFVLLIQRLVYIASKTRDNYSKFFVLGAIFYLLIHFLFNTGANLGFLPVTGLPFPFLSYGGSYLLTLAIFMSIIQSIEIESR